MSKTDRTVWVVLSILPFVIAFLVLALFGVNLEYTTLASTILWIIIYFFWIGKHFWIQIDPNHGVVLQDYFKKEVAEKDASVIGGAVNQAGTPTADKKSLRIPNGQRAVFSGLNSKLPWEFPAAPPINMVKETDCGDTISVQGKDSFRYTVTYKCPLTPVRSIYLPRFLMVEEKTAIFFFKSHVESRIRKMFSENDGKVICDDITKFSEEYLSTLFKGDQIITDEENHYGRFTNTPLITDAKAEKSGQDAAEVGARANKLAEAIEKLTDKGMSANVAAALLEGKDVELIDIGGNVDPAMAALLAARNKGNKKGKGSK
ncbi:MAG: hypothetical protein EB170_07785 [Nitrosopumilaceae archaeon]|nr:hypothetical protein [Nitrosopumilaceae archaeon]